MDSTLQHKHITDLLHDYDVFLFDLWGVVIEEGITYTGVVDQINAIIPQKKVYFVSNAPRPNYRVMDTLIKFGFKNLTQDMITTSGDIARQYIKDFKPSLESDAQRKVSIYHLGADRNEDILDKIEHKKSQSLNDCDILLLSLYRDDHEDISEFNALLESAAKLNPIIICANPDTTIPKHGITRYCAGYFANIIEQYGGNVIYTGKPGTEIYQKIFTVESKIPKNRILMIGDTFETDILGAQRTGIHSALVLTGNAAKFHQHLQRMQDKLYALTKIAKEINIMPTVVTTLS